MFEFDISVSYVKFVIYFLNMNSDLIPNVFYQSVDDFPYLIASSKTTGSEKSQQNNANASHCPFVLAVLCLDCALEIPNVLYIACREFNCL